MLQALPACGPELGPARPARFVEVVSAMAERGSARGRAWKVAGPARTGVGAAGATVCADSFSPVSAKASGRARHHRHHDPRERLGAVIEAEAASVLKAPNASQRRRIPLVMAEPDRLRDRVEGRRACQDGRGGEVGFLAPPTKATLTLELVAYHLLSGSTGSGRLDPSGIAWVAE